MTVDDQDTPWHPQFFEFPILSQFSAALHASSFVDRLAHIARGGPRRTLGRASELNISAAHLRQKNVHIVLAKEAREGPNAEDKAERLMAATGNHLEDMMADRHPLGIAGDVAGKSSDTQSAFRQLWKK